MESGAAAELNQNLLEIRFRLALETMRPIGFLAAVIPVIPMVDMIWNFTVSISSVIHSEVIALARNHRMTWIVLCMDSQESQRVSRALRVSILQLEIQACV